VSASSPQAALRRAGDLGRRHGRAAVYWQIGDSPTTAAREFYHQLLRGIASADPAVTDLFQVPDLTARWDYERASLAADLGLADGDPDLDEAAEVFLGAAREEFWLEAARLARRRLAPGDADEDGTEPETPGDGEAAPDWRQDISDPAPRPTLTSGWPGLPPSSPGRRTSSAGRSAAAMPPASRPRPRAGPARPGHSTRTAGGLTRDGSSTTTPTRPPTASPGSSSCSTPRS
jgi:hypothetical protein